MDTTLFFLRNRELAGLVLDYCDRRTIGTFRLLCKQADACARTTYIRKSTRGILSYRSLQFTRDISVEFIKARVSRWNIIFVRDIRGLVNFSRLLKNVGNLVLDGVVTIVFDRPVFDQYFGKDRNVDVSSALTGRVFDALAYYLRPRNMCVHELSLNNDGFVEMELLKLIYTWRIQNLTSHNCKLLIGLVSYVPHQHIHFCPTMSPTTIVNAEFHAEGIKTITYRRRPAPVLFIDNDNEEHFVPSDLFGDSNKDVEFVSLRGIRHCFPASPRPECPFCGRM